MRRLVLVGLFVLLSCVSWAPSATRAATSDLPDAPQASGNGLEFSVESALSGSSIGDPIALGKRDDGKHYVVAAITVDNTSDASKLLYSKKFRIVNGKDYIKPDQDLSDGLRDTVDLQATGDIVAETLAAGDTREFGFVWLVPSNLRTVKLDLDYGDADAVDLKPWIDQDTAAADLSTTTSSTGRSSANTNESAPTAKPTSRPTSRPTARPTAAPDPDKITSAEQDYLDAQAREQNMIGLAASSLGDLFGQLDGNSYLLLDSTWNSKVDTQFAIIRRADAEAQALSPSVRQQSIQDQWLQITGLTVQASDEIDTGLTNLDPDSLQAGSNDLTQATALLNPLQSDIQNFKDDPASFGTDTSINGDGGSTGGGVVSDCSAFASYDSAQTYYANHPEAQPVIDPNDDGRACEVYFGQG